MSDGTGGKGCSKLRKKGGPETVAQTERQGEDPPADRCSGQDRLHAGGPISTQVFEVTALVFVPLFPYEYVGSARMISRPFPISHYEACDSTSRVSEEGSDFPAPDASL